MNQQPRFTEPHGTTVSKRKANIRVSVLSIPQAPACILQTLAELILIVTL